MFFVRGNDKYWCLHCSMNEYMARGITDQPHLIENTWSMLSNVLGGSIADHSHKNLLMEVPDTLLHRVMMRLICDKCKNTLIDLTKVTRAARPETAPLDGFKQLASLSTLERYMRVMVMVPRGEHLGMFDQIRGTGVPQYGRLLYVYDGHVFVELDDLDIWRSGINILVCPIGPELYMDMQWQRYYEDIRDIALLWEVIPLSEREQREHHARWRYKMVIPHEFSMQAQEKGLTSTGYAASKRVAIFDIFSKLSGLGCIQPCGGEPF